MLLTQCTHYLKKRNDQFGHYFGNVLYIIIKVRKLVENVNFMIFLCKL